MMAHDRQRFPGGCMAGFICWISEQLTAFCKLSPGAFIGQHLYGHKAFDEFLQTREIEKGEMP
jgi:hypothetical protein